MINGFFISPSLQVEKEVNIEPEEVKRCPFCAEFILLEAKKCKHFRSDLEINWYYHLCKIFLCSYFNQKGLEKIRKLMIILRIF
jgi:hypothetical protein